MAIDAILKVYNAQPFRPFTIHTADGRSYHVPHRDFMWLPPTRRTVLVGDEEEEFSIIAAELVTGLDVLPPDGGRGA